VSLDRGGPVTLSIVRHIAPEHAAQLVAWARAGFSLAERFPGFLGTGWVGPAGHDLRPAALDDPSAAE